MGKVRWETLEWDDIKEENVKGSLGIGVVFVDDGSFLLILGGAVAWWWPGSGLGILA